MILKSLGLERMMILGGSISFKETELERMISNKSTPSNNENFKAVSPKCITSLDLSKLKREAVIKLLEVYKSSRTGRKIADYVVLIKQICFAELEWSSISFFDKEKHETAISRWSRAKTRAAKVGKGLSKNDKALKLALQHWLEAIDPHHRYGHNLRFYYDKWLDSNCKEPFFYWLDIGEGKELNLIETCPRSQLKKQCIKYLSPVERIAYEVVLNEGKFLFKKTGELLHTTGDAKWIFVLSISKTLYVGQKKKGSFQHSSFLAGGATIAAGMLVVENGILKAVWPHSSHYRPTIENFKEFILFLRENNVDLTDVKMPSPVGNQKCSSSEDLAQAWNNLGTEVIYVKDLVQEETDPVEEAAIALEPSKTKRLCNPSRNLTYLEIPKRDEMIGRLQNDRLALGPICNDNSMDSLVEDLYGTSEEAFAPKQQIVDEDCEEIEQIAQESCLQSVNSKKKSNSYQLEEQLSCKQKTGAGLQIGCVRYSLSGLHQFRMNLSTRSTSRSKLYFSRCSASGLSLKVIFSITL